MSEIHIQISSEFDSSGLDEAISTINKMLSQSLGSTSKNANGINSITENLKKQAQAAKDTATAMRSLNRANEGETTARQASANAAANVKELASIRELVAQIQQQTQTRQQQAEAAQKASETLQREQELMSGVEGSLKQVSQAALQSAQSMTAMQKASTAVNSVISGIRNVASAAAAGLQALARAAQAAASVLAGALVKGIGMARSGLSSLTSSAASKFANMRKDLDMTGLSFLKFGRSADDGMTSFEKTMQRTAAGWSLLLAGRQIQSTGLGMFRGLQNEMGNYLGLDQASLNAAISGNTSQDDILQMAFKMERGQYGGLPVKMLSTQDIMKGIYYYTSAVGTDLNSEQNKAGVAQALAPILNLAGFTGNAPEPLIKGVLNAGMEYGISPSDTKAMSQIASLYGYVSNMTTMEPQDLSNYFSMMGGLGNVLSPTPGMGALQETMAWAWINSEYGQRGGRPARGLNALVSSLLSPTAKMNKTAQSLWGTDIAGEFFTQTPDGRYVLKGGVGGLITPFLGMSDKEWKQAQATLFTQGASRSIIPLISEARKDPGRFNKVVAQTQDPEHLAYLMNATSKANGSLTATVQDLSNAWGQLNANIVGSVKGNLIEGLSKLADGIRGIADVVHNTPELGKFFAGMATGLAALVTMAGTMLTAAGAALILQRAFAILGEGSGVIMTALTAIPRTLAMLSPFFLAAAAAAVVLRTAWDHNVFGIQDKWQHLVTYFKGHTLKQMLGDFLNLPAVTGAIVWTDRIGHAFGQFISGILLGQGPINDLAKLMESVFGQELGSRITGSLVAFEGLLQKTYHSIGGLFDGIGKGLPALSTFGSALQGVMNFLVLGHADYGMIQALDQIGQYFGVNGLSIKVANFASQFRQAFSEVTAFLGGYKDQIISTLGEIGDKLATFLKPEILIGAFQVVLGFIEGFAAGVLLAFEHAISLVNELLGALQKLGSAGQWLANWVQQVTGFNTKLLDTKTILLDLGRVLGLALGAKWATSMIAPLNDLNTITKFTVSILGQVGVTVIGLVGNLALLAAQYAIVGTAATLAWVSQIPFLGPIAIGILAIVAAGTVLVGIFGGLGAAGSFLSGVFSGFMAVVSTVATVLWDIGSVIYAIVSGFFQLAGAVSGLLGGFISLHSVGAALGVVLGVVIAAGLVSMIANMSAVQAALSGAAMAVGLLGDAFMLLTGQELAADAANPGVLIGVAIVAGVALAIAALAYLTAQTGSVRNAFIALGRDIISIMAQAATAIPQMFLSAIGETFKVLGKVPGMKSLGLGDLGKEISGLNLAQPVLDAYDALTGPLKTKAEQAGESTGMSFQEGLTKVMGSIGLGGIANKIGLTKGKMDIGSIVKALFGFDPSQLQGHMPDEFLAKSLLASGYSPTDTSWIQAMRAAQKDTKNPLNTTAVFSAAAAISQVQDLTKATQDNAQADQQAEADMKAFLDTATKVGGLDNFTTQMRLLGTGGEPIKVADNLNQANAAMAAGYEVAVQNTQAMSDNAQQLLDWGDKLIGQRGTWAQMDDLIGQVDLQTGKATISLQEYNAAQDAYDKIAQNTAAIQQDVLAIQVKQAPVLADLQGKQAAYLDTVKDMSGIEQMAALAAMDQNEQLKAQQALTLAAAAASGQYGAAGQQMATQLIQGAASADPYLSALLQKMGLISVGAHGEIKVNFPNADTIQHHLDELMKSIDALTQALGGVPPLHVDSSGVVQVTAQVEALRKSIRGLNDDLVQNGTKGGAGQSRPYGPNPGGDLPPGTPVYKDPKDLPHPTATTANPVTAALPTPAQTQAAAVPQGAAVAAGVSQGITQNQGQISTAINTTITGIKIDAKSLNSQVTGLVTGFTSQLTTALSTQLAPAMTQAFNTALGGGQVGLGATGHGGESPLSGVMKGYATQAAKDFKTQFQTEFQKAITDIFSGGMTAGASGGAGGGAAGAKAKAPDTTMFTATAQTWATGLTTAFKTEFQKQMQTQMSGIMTTAFQVPTVKAPAGSAHGSEPQFDAIAQSWATSLATSFKGKFQKTMQDQMSGIMSTAFQVPTVKAPAGSAHGSEPQFDALAQSWAMSLATSLKAQITTQLSQVLGPALQEAFTNATSGGNVLSNPLLSGQLGNGGAATQGGGMFDSWASSIAQGMATSLKSAIAREFPAALASVQAQIQAMMGSLGGGSVGGAIGAAAGVAGGGGGMTITVHVRADISNFTSQAQLVIGLSGALGQLNPIPKIGVDYSAFAAGAQGVIAACGAIGALQPIPTILANDSAFMAVAWAVEGELNKIGGMVATPTVNLNDYASGAISSIAGQLSALDGRVATVTVSTVNTVTTVSNPVKAFASGGVFNGPGNYAWVGEKGPELVRLPWGSRVYDHTTSARMAADLTTVTPTVNAQLATRSGGNVQTAAVRSQGDVKVEVNFNEPVYVRDKTDLRKIAQAVSAQIARDKRLADRGMTSTGN